ncbi:MAG: SDR family oxidoreductase [Streptosporangiaceae bacterium]
MSIKTVTVFCASGRQGLAQVRQLRRQGYAVRAVTRRKPVIDGPDFDGVTWLPADLDTPESLDAALAGADAAFFTPPAFAESVNRFTQHQNVGEAAVRNGLQRLVYNTSVYIPKTLGSEPPYDYVLEGVLLLERAGAPIVTFGPVLFMDNLLADWSKPGLLEGRFSYPHKPGFRASWMALDDVAFFMIEALKRDDLLGERIVLGGPEVLTPELICTTLSEVFRRPVVHNPITPRQFGEVMWEIFGSVSGTSREAFVQQLDGFYTYSNEGPAEPFAVDMAPVIERIPVPLTTLARWAPAQDWAVRDDRPPGG